ncbi:hypothetical protein [Geoglobus ahangari]
MTGRCSVSGVSDPGTDINFGAKLVALRRWSEIVGYVAKVILKENVCFIVFEGGYAVLLPNNRHDSESMMELIGHKVSILRTDKMDKEYTVKDENTNRIFVFGKN